MNETYVAYMAKRVTKEVKQRLERRWLTLKEEKFYNRKDVNYSIFQYTILFS